MNYNSISDCEQSKWTKLFNYRLPNQYKKIGWTGFALSMVFLLSTIFFDGDLEILKEILKRLLLVFLLVVVISKEKEEDEMIKTIRAQAFSMAFIGGVFYTLLQPIVNFIASLIVGDEMSVFEELGDFQILWFLMIIYLVVFNKLKKRA